MARDRIDYGDWIGRTDVVEERLAPGPVAQLRALLDHRHGVVRDGDALPPLGHWLYCHHAVPQSELGKDGHRRRGRFLPPLPQEHRLWAGSRIEYHVPLRVGDVVTRSSKIAAIADKEGRSGAFVLVRLLHEFSCRAMVALVEDQSLIFRHASRDGGAAAAPIATGEAEFSRTCSPDAVLLFRYSAVTQNPHRIHYDRPYARDVEGYPGLVVHGPLVATLLADLVDRQGRDGQLASFDCRALAPVFEGDTVVLAGRDNAGRAGASLWATTGRGTLAMDANIVFR